MPNRRIPPIIHPVSKVVLPVPEQMLLSNGIPLYRIPPGQEEMLRLDILIDAGRPREKAPLAARAVGSLLKEGTASFSGAEVAEQFDFYGATLSTPFQMDGIHLVVYTLSKHASKIIPIVASVLLEPTFPDTELDNMKERYARHLEVELRKTDVVAYRELTQHLFGKSHPYGYNSTSELYNNITRQMVREHYQTHFHAGNCRLILSGGAGEAIIQLIDRLICQPMRKGSNKPFDIPAPSIEQPSSYRQSLLPSVQTAIRIGRRVPTRHHPDYPGLYLLNTILGGYFGSRLMANIREEKGYTYNIYSSLDSMRFGAYFYIGTEVGHEFVEPTLDEIKKEIHQLQHEPVPEEELQMVKNYIMGSYLTLLDGPFQVADLIKGFLLEDVPFEQFKNWIEEINVLDEDRILELANLYLADDEMWEVIVGNAS